MLQRMITLDPEHSALIMDPAKGLFYVAPASNDEHAYARALVVRALFYVAHDPSGMLGLEDAIVRVMTEDGAEPEGIAIVRSQFAENSEIIAATMNLLRPATTPGEAA